MTASVRAQHQPNFTLASQGPSTDDSTRETKTFRSGSAQSSTIGENQPKGRSCAPNSVQNISDNAISRLPQAMMLD